MTWSGPCMYHCGSRVTVGVSVEVGSGVSDGTKVDVPVGDTIGVMVAGGVGEGSGSVVQVGSMTGVGAVTRLNPPHPMMKRANADIQITIFLVIAGRRFALSGAVGEA